MRIYFNKEVRIGLLMILILVFFIWGYSFLKGKNLLSPTNNYYAVYERVGGLMESGHVMLSGYRVGYVDDIRFSDDQRYLLVRLSVDKGINLPEGTVARIVSSDFMGTKAINLYMGVSDRHHSPDDTLISEIEPDLLEGLMMQIEPVRYQAEKMMASIDSVFIAVNSMLDAEMQDNISESMVNIKATTSSLRQSITAMEGMFTSDDNPLEGIMTNIEKASGNFASLSDSLVRSDIINVIANMNNVLDDLARVVEKAGSGEGSLGKLLADEELYNNLESAAENLDKLIIDLKEHPGRYVNFSIFGRRRD